MVRTRRLVCVLTLLAGALPLTVRAQNAAERPLLIVAELDGIIHPISAEYLTGVIDEADTSGASLVVFVLRTPGGLLDSTRTIVSRMITSRAPVAVFVGPAGARAASAGFVVTIAADVAAMAPGTHIGAAHPVAGSGQPMDETMAQKAASDTAAYVRSLAEARARNVALAEAAVTESRAFTDAEAANANPPLIDLIVGNVDELVAALDGRRIRRFDGRATTLETSNAEIRRIPMTRRQQFLGAIANPQIAYLLLTLGTLGLTIELWNPGSILPGVAGGLCLLLAFFALQILSVSTTGVLLIVFGVGLIVLELKLPSFGALGVGGAVSILVGSLMVTRSVPGAEVSLSIILPMVVALAGGVLLLGRLALAAQRLPPATGSEALIGVQAVARTPIAPGSAGTVAVHGELWQARSDAPVNAAELVRITAVNGLTLTVVPDATNPRTGDAAWKA